MTAPDLRTRADRVLAGHASWAYAFSVIRDLLAALASFTRDPADICGGCGGPYRYDISIPSPLWNAVVRAAGGPELLCATCILGLFAKAGVSFTAELSGDGFSLLPIEVRIAGAEAQSLHALMLENAETKHARRPRNPSHLKGYPEAERRYAGKVTEHQKPRPAPPIRRSPWPRVEERR